MTSEFLSVVFCPPTGPWENVPDRLGDRVFETLRSVGVNRIAAYGMDDRLETRERTFTQCEKFGIGYLPCVPSAEDYCRVLPQNGKKSWGELTNQEKQELDSRFVKEVEAYLPYPAFRGVFFEDECGYLSFPGIAHAKGVFDVHFPGYEFHANFFSYSINEDIFWGGMAFHGHPGAAKGLQLPFDLTGDMAITFQNRFRFYDVLVEGLLSRTHFELISQDKYPFESFWPEVPTSVHRALFELNAFLKKKAVKYGSSYYNFMQVGQWSDCNRPMTFGEMALQMNVTVAYGAAGFGWFPGVFPLDWRKEPGFQSGAQGGAAFIDLQGKPTVYAQWAGKLNRFLSDFSEDIVNAQLLGAAAYGSYRNGFCWDKVKALPDSECIYNGQIPEILQYTDERITAQCTNQLLLSTFQKDGKRRYYGVNTSSVFENQIVLTLPEGKYTVCAMGQKFQSHREVRTTLEPGCGIYIMEQ